MTRIDTDTIRKTIEMFNKIYNSFIDKYIVLIQNQIPQKVEGYDTMEADLDVIKANDIWNEFITGKQCINIPLKYEIAYPLSLSKLLPLKNELFLYIEEFYNIISKLFNLD